MGMFFSTAIQSATQEQTAVYPDGSQWVKDNQRGWIMVTPPKDGKPTLPPPDKLNATKNAAVISGITTKATNAAALANAQKRVDSGAVLPGEKKPNNASKNASKNATNAVKSANAAATNASSAAVNASKAANVNKSTNAPVVTPAVAASNNAAVAAANATKAANNVSKAVATNAPAPVVNAAANAANSAAKAANSAAVKANNAALKANNSSANSATVKANNASANSMPQAGGKKKRRTMRR